MKLSLLQTKSAYLITSFVFAGLLLLGSSLNAKQPSFNHQMHSILDSYLVISEALAADKTDGIKEAAKKISGIASKLRADKKHAEHAEHIKQFSVKLNTASKMITGTKKIEDIRKAFKDLSEPMAMWVGWAKPEGIHVAHCSMAKGSWLQKGKTISNPYYGSKMLRCGEIKDGQDTKKKGAHDHHMKHAHKHAH